MNTVVEVTVIETLLVALYEIEVEEGLLRVGAGCRLEGGSPIVASLEDGSDHTVPSVETRTYNDTSPP
nr:hypothetical protein [bacterium]